MNAAEKRYASERINAIASEKLETLVIENDAAARAVREKYEKLFAAHKKKSPKSATYAEKIKAIMAGKVPLCRGWQREYYGTIIRVWNLKSFNDTPAQKTHEKIEGKIKAQKNKEMSRLERQHYAAREKIYARQTEILDELNIGDADKALELINQFKNE